MKREVCVLAITLLVCLSSFAKTDFIELSDSSGIRREITSSWLTASFDDIRGKDEEFKENRAGEIFQVRMEEANEVFDVIVSPQSELDIDLASSSGHKIVRAAVFPKGGRGSWVLRRSKKTGLPVEIQWHFSQDADVFLVLRPNGRKSAADLVVFGSFAAKGVPLGVPFDRLYAASFIDVQKWTSRTLPWNKVTPSVGLHSETIVMAGTIKDNLSSMVFADNVCYDERGKLVPIMKDEPLILKGKDGELLEIQEGVHYLSGAGFLKWIIDGIVEPTLGRGTRIDDITEETVEIDSVGKIGVMSQEWNLMFTLDWCRNLAAQAYSARSRRNEDFRTAGLDVNKNFFASNVSGGNLSGSSGYVKNTGYAVERLKSVLYVLAATETGWFYLGAVRQSSYIKPEEFVFNNCAVFFPYFDNDGKFGCFVFEQCEQVLLEDFAQKYNGAFVHLERVKATDAFFPYEKRR